MLHYVLITTLTLMVASHIQDKAIGKSKQWYRDTNVNGRETMTDADLLMARNPYLRGRVKRNTHKGAEGTILYKCDFETFCTYLKIGVEQSDYKWLHGQGETNSSGTGPKADHTTGTSAGRYMYTEASSGKPGEVAALSTPRYRAIRRDYCLSLYYHMYGDHIGKLIVYFNNVDRPVGSYILLSESGSRGKSWKLLRTTFEAVVGETFTIKINATRGVHYQGDISIDDFKVTYGSCNEAHADAIIVSAFALIADSGRGQIFKLDLNTGAHTTLTIDDTQYKMTSPRDVTYDSKDRRVYWADSKEGNLYGMNLDGTDIRPFMVAQGASIEGVTVDHSGTPGIVYYTDGTNAAIGAFTLSNGARKDIVTTGLGTPRDIQIHTVSSYLYVTDWGRTPRLLKVSTTGMNLQTIVQGKMKKPSGLTLDLPAKQIYWCDAAFGKVEVANLDGTERKLVWQKANAPLFGLAIWQQYIYVTDESIRQIHRMQKDGSGYSLYGPSEFNTANGIVIRDIQGQQSASWNQWSKWSDCSRRCEVGTRNRTRTCRGESCAGSPIQTMRCQGKSSTDECHVTGWSEWSAWRECLENCYQTRNRTCRGGDCPGNTTESKQCCTRQTGHFGPWLRWSACKIATCERTRRRFCRGGQCSGNKSETQQCPESCTPKWSQWNPWSECSLTCGTGESTRSRKCTPSGTTCTGALSDRKDCMLKTCEGRWSEWNSWSQCSQTCGGGQRQRSRKCMPEMTRCPTGSPDAIQSCNTNKCDDKGSWGEWQAWSVCSKTCGTGVRTAERSCQPPDAKCEGALKVTSDSCREVDECKDDWNEWSSWGQCSKSCGIGTQTRKRPCKAFNCFGHSEDVIVCRKDPCEGTWRKWADWGGCGVTCGSTVITRTRHCDTANCLGDLKQTKQCVVNPRRCPKEDGP